MHSIFINIRNIIFRIFYNNNFHKKGKNNNIIFDVSSLFKCTKINITGNNNTIVFGKNCRISGLSILINGNNNKIILGDSVIINASKLQPTIINAINGTEIFIGEHSVLSNNIEIHSSDYHKIYDQKHKQINPDSNIYIGKHCWICMRAMILKGAHIEDNSVVGAGTIITKNFTEANTIIVGSPPRIIKSDINWVL